VRWIEQAHMDKVLAHIEQAEGGGLQGSPAVRAQMPKRALLCSRLTIFADETITNASSVARDEIFGPVLAVIARHRGRGYRHR
jgi:gamma-glutamyl-gamma-aminobutyraldehyde dehydrogenase